MSDSESTSYLPQFIITTEGDIHGEDTAENRELVRRIHACVNACEEITTEELERGIIHDMRRVITHVAPLLADQRNALQARVRPDQVAAVADDSAKKSV